MQMSATLKTGQWGTREQVDDVAAQRPGVAQQPVGEVAADAGEQQPERHRPDHVAERGG